MRGVVRRLIVRTICGLLGFGAVWLGTDAYFDNFGVQSTRIVPGGIEVGLGWQGAEWGSTLMWIGLVLWVYAIWPRRLRAASRAS